MGGSSARLPGYQHAGAEDAGAEDAELTSRERAGSEIVVSKAEEPGLPGLIDSPLGLGLASAAGARVTGAAARTGRLGLRRGG